MSKTTKEKIITYREVLQAPFIGPKQVSLFTKQSIPTARKQLVKIQSILEKDGIIALSKTLVPTHAFIQYFCIDIEYLEKNGIMDKPIQMEGKN